MPCGILILVSLNVFFLGIFIRFMSRPLPFYSEFERTLFLSCMLWSQVVLRYECTWGIAIPPESNVCPLQVPLLPPLPWTDC